ncbi:GNAT family N-acetyltransferase [Burkholderia sp. RF4-BP95]|uniref:GNAT family N-acetyltransferase n=1 Tax=Burkholderia sp. RF4-BP95 TaxID=1637845 RepID=UPI00075A1607|nr:GNAT family N-acetyltransferase [Burkholderia sp. RF4-BP95]KUY85543.1 GCN5 family acetyltransferase [Burkholderia sp. RF4-BP95]
MQRPESARSERAYAAYAKRLDGRVVVRRFDPRSDSYESLTALLHRAYAPLGAAGFNCPGVDQPASATRERMLTGECFVALGNAHLVATITMQPHDPDSRCDPYRSRRVATLGQLAVDPVWQDRGIGRALLAFAQQRAAARGATHLALDAPHAAIRLVDFYRREGFQLIDVMRFAGHSYDSAILCKAVGSFDGRIPASDMTSIHVARRAGAAS